MHPAKELLEKHTVVILNEALKRGFMQLPNYVLRDKQLSFGARLAYAVLLSYAWQEESCFPGQARMARDLGVSRRMLSDYLKELKQRGYIAWERTGLNKTNIYYLLDYQPFQANGKPGSHLDRKRSSHSDEKWG